MMNWDGFFWYSEKQKQVYRQFGHTYTNACNIGGKVKEYTQWMSGKYLRNPSRWEDAICLGYGFVVTEKHIPYKPL